MNRHYNTVSTFAWLVNSDTQTRIYCCWQNKSSSSHKHSLWLSTSPTYSNLQAFMLMELQNAQSTYNAGATGRRLRINYNICTRGIRWWWVWRISNVHHTLQLVVLLASSTSNTIMAWMLSRQFQNSFFSLILHCVRNCHHQQSNPSTRNCVSTSITKSIQSTDRPNWNSTSTRTFSGHGLNEGWTK